MKHYEKIQSMSLEELAEVIQCPLMFTDTVKRCYMIDMYGAPITCTQCKMSWLQEEKEEEKPYEAIF